MIVNELLVENKDSIANKKVLISRSFYSLAS